MPYHYVVTPDPSDPVVDLPGDREATGASEKKDDATPEFSTFVLSPAAP